MSFFQSLLASSNPYDVFLAIGDSIMAGRNNSTGYGTTPTAGTVKQWDNISAVIDVGATDVVTAITDNGSPLPQFGIDYYNATRRIPVIVPRGVSSSTFYTMAGYTSWLEGATNYDDAIIAANDCLSYLGVNKLKGILVNLGINDIRTSASIALVEGAVDSLFTSLIADFPGVPILVSIPGRKENGTATTNFNDSRHYAVKYRIIQNAINNADVHIVGNLGALVEPGLYSADSIHPAVGGDNQMGSWYARWFSLGNYSKWGRSVISSLFDDISDARKTLIDNFVSSQVTSGNWFKLEALGVFKTTTENNCWLDWAFLGFFASAGHTFTANVSIATNGTDQHLSTTCLAGINNKRASQNDLIEGVKIDDNSSTGNAFLFGASDGVVVKRIAQTGVDIPYFVNDNTTTNYGGETVFADDSVYSITRNGTTKALFKNKTSVSSATVSSVNVNSTAFTTIGAYNNNGTIQTRLNSSYEYYFYAKYSDFDLDNFYDNIEIMVDGW